MGAYSTPPFEITLLSRDLPEPPTDITAWLLELTTPLSAYSTPPTDITEPLSDYSTPLSDFSTPLLDFSTPSSDIFTPFREPSTPLSDFFTPLFAYSTPSWDLSVPSVDIPSLSEDIPVPSWDYRRPSADYSTTSSDSSERSLDSSALSSAFRGSASLGVSFVTAIVIIRDSGSIISTIVSAWSKVSVSSLSVSELSYVPKETGPTAVILMPSLVTLPFRASAFLGLSLSEVVPRDVEGKALASSILPLVLAFSFYIFS